MENCYLYVTLPICQFDGEKSKNLKKDSEPPYQPALQNDLGFKHRSLSLNIKYFKDWNINNTVKPTLEMQ